MAGAEQHPDIANQRLLTHKGKTLAALAFLFKHQSNRLDIYIQADGGLKQAGMKRLYIQPRRSRTFREQAHGITTLETHGHLLADDLNGKAKHVGGKVKEGLGELLGDNKMKREGRLAQQEGEAEQDADRARERVREAEEREAAARLARKQSERSDA